MKAQRTDRQAVFKGVGMCAAFIAAVFLFSGVVLAADKNVEDSDITAAIEADYWADDAVNSNRIDIKTKDGIVTLSGTVENLLAKERAARIAGATAGVRAVVNRLNVVPAVGRTGSEIENSVENALLTDPATEFYEVEVNVDNSVVKLTGQVVSWQEKQLAAKVAKSVKGIKGLTNNIEVVYKSERPDIEIENEIEARLANDVRVDDVLIDVKGNNNQA